MDLEQSDDDILDAEIEADEPVVDTEAEAEIEDAPEIETDDDAETEEQTEAEAEDVLTVSLGEEDEPEETPVIRTIRDKNREQAKRIKELEAKLSAGTSAEPKTVLGPKPKLEDFDYDADKFEEELVKWSDAKRKVEAETKAEAEKAKEFQSKYDARLQTYNEAKAALGARDFEDAETSVRDTLSPAQQSIIVANAKRPELLVYALGKNPDVAAKLAGSPDLVSFAYQLAQIEASMKVTGTTKPTPEKRVKGGSGPALSSDKQLERLEAEADRTGDRTKVLAYKKSLRKK